MNIVSQMLQWLFRDSPTVWPLCAFFFILLQFYVPFYVKKKKNDNFMCLLEFECAKRLKAHSRAVPAVLQYFAWAQMALRPKRQGISSHPGKYPRIFWFQYQKGYWSVKLHKMCECVCGRGVGGGRGGTGLRGLVLHRLQSVVFPSLLSVLTITQEKDQWRSLLFHNAACSQLLTCHNIPELARFWRMFKEGASGLEWLLMPWSHLLLPASRCSVAVTVY